jgi:hypothetical protein
MYYTIFNFFFFFELFVVVVVGLNFSFFLQVYALLIIFHPRGFYIILAYDVVMYIIIKNKKIGCYFK